MGGKKGVVVLMLATVVLSAVFGICSAKSYVVGGSTGWTIPTSASFYSSWASKNKLQVGDVLVFTFPAGVHTVAEVSKTNYDGCTTASTIGPVMATAPANITLTKTGKHYYICTITGHCLANQKLAVTVVSAASAPALSPSTSPVAAPAPAPAFAPTPAPAPAPAPTSTPTTLAPVPAPSTVPPEALTPEGGPAAAASPPTPNVSATTAVTLFTFFSILAIAFFF